MSRFSDRFEAHGKPVIEREHGVDVTLKRGTVASTAFRARRGPRLNASFGEEIATGVAVEVRTYILPIADCVISAATVKPQAGWTVVDGSDTWEIHHPNTETPAVEPHQDGYDWLCHTRLVL